MQKSEVRQIQIIFNPLQLGENDYIIGICINKDDELIKLKSHLNSDRYDLLNKSFILSVKTKIPSDMPQARFHQSTEWYLPTN